MAIPRFLFRRLWKHIFISGLFFYAPKTQPASSLDELKASLAELEERAESTNTESIGNETDEEPTIVVADGAFDSLTSHMESEKRSGNPLRSCASRKEGCPYVLATSKWLSLQRYSYFKKEMM